MTGEDAVDEQDGEVAYGILVGPNAVNRSMQCWRRL